MAVIANRDDFYSYYKMRQLLQNATLIINDDSATDIKSKYWVYSFFSIFKMIILEKNKAIVVFSSENQNLKKQHEKGKTKAT